jgi:hypothetical protein
MCSRFPSSSKTNAPAVKDLRQETSKIVQVDAIGSLATPRIPKKREKMFSVYIAVLRFVKIKVNKVDRSDEGNLRQRDCLF